ncbi:hypothetical protein F5884DRAFT_851362 [Xylogone sp. PMI_703]|nr:hypothetical protein F5884DRAFT_851362 [Xylogone sp. PMI_703]
MSPTTSSTSQASETLRRFIKTLEDRDRYGDDDLENLDDGEGYTMVSDPKLGVRLVHAGIHPEAVHCRHIIYMVIERHGKAAKRVAPPGTVVASIHTAQYTKRKALCKALLLSLQSKGKRVVANHPDSSRSRCPICGHNAVFRSVCYSRNFWTSDDYDWKSCCSGDGWWSSYGAYTCCACKEGIMSGFSTEAASKLSDNTPKMFSLDDPYPTPAQPAAAFPFYPQAPWQDMQNLSIDGQSSTNNYFFHQQNVYVGDRGSGSGRNDYLMLGDSRHIHHHQQKLLPEVEVEEVDEEINAENFRSIEGAEVLPVECTSSGKSRRRKEIKN